MMTPQHDGRTLECDYCHTKVKVAVEAQQLAAGMRLDLGNIDGFLSELANTLSRGYGEWTRISANGPHVQAIEINVEPDLFMVRREAHGVLAQHRKLVRGISLKTETLALERWVAMLTEALARQANANANAAWVLSRLSGSL